MTRTALILACLIFGAAGCAKNHQTADHEQCSKQGFETGTKNYDDCRAQLETARDARGPSNNSYGGTASGLTY